MQSLRLHVHILRLGPLCYSPYLFIPQTRKIRGFIKPRESLAKTLEKSRGAGAEPRKRPNYRNDPDDATARTSANYHDEPQSESTGQCIRGLLSRSQSQQVSALGVC